MPDLVITGIVVTIGSLIALATLACVGVLIAAWIGSTPFRNGDTEPPEDHLTDLGDNT